MRLSAMLINIFNLQQTFVVLVRAAPDSCLYLRLRVPYSLSSGPRIHLAVQKSQDSMRMRVDEMKANPESMVNNIASFIHREESGALITKAAKVDKVQSTGPAT